MIGTNDENGNYTPEPGGGGTELVYNTAGSSRALVTMAGATHFSAYLGGERRPSDTRAAITSFLNVAERHDPGAPGRPSAPKSPPEACRPNRTSASLVLAALRRGNGFDYRRQGVLDRFQQRHRPELRRRRTFGGAPRLSSPVVGDRRHSRRGRLLAGHPSRVGVHHRRRRLPRRPSGDSVSTHRSSASAADPVTGGYWLLGGDGGVFSSDAAFYGSTGNIRLNAPAVGMVATSDGKG